MSNPFTAPTLSAYNASPPSDDGSATDANTIKWATHINKIGDPLKSYAQAISSNAATAFGKMFGAAVDQKSADYTITTSDQGKVISATAGGLTFTLPPAASAGANFVVCVRNDGPGTVTVDGNSSETIDGSTTLDLPYDGQTAILVCDASSWYALLSDSGNGEIHKVHNVIQSWTNDTTYADISGFTVDNLRADRWYGFDARFSYDQNGGDFKTRLLFSQTQQILSACFLEAISESQDHFINVDTALTSGANINTMTDTDQVSVTISGVFKTNATTGGSFDIQAAQLTSDSDATRVLYGQLVVRDLGA